MIIREVLTFQNGGWIWVPNLSCPEGTSFSEAAKHQPTENTVPFRVSEDEHNITSHFWKKIEDTLLLISE